MGMIYLAEGKIDSALYYLNEAFETLSTEGFLVQSQLASQTLAEVYFKTNNIQSAKTYYLLSENLLEEELGNNSFFTLFLG